MENSTSLQNASGTLHSTTWVGVGERQSSTTSPSLGIPFPSSSMLYVSGFTSSHWGVWGPHGLRLFVCRAPSSLMHPEMILLLVQSESGLFYLKVQIFAKWQKSFISQQLWNLKQVNITVFPQYPYFFFRLMPNIRTASLYSALESKVMYFPFFNLFKLY